MGSQIVPAHFTCTFTGIVEWLVYSGIGGESTVTNALSGCDFKQAIYLHKLIFEAIIRTKVKHFNYCSNFLTEKGRKLLEHFQKCVNFENLSNLLQQLKPIPFIPGDMSCWIELYLEMVNLLLKVIKFQTFSKPFEIFCDFVLL